MDRTKIVGFGIVLLMLTLLVACDKEDHKPIIKKDDMAMLTDKQPDQATSRNLIRLEERPVFPVDDNKKSFASLEDRTDKKPPKDEPMPFREMKMK